MKKTYNLEDLDCANCAVKMENAIRKVEGVISVSVNFLTLKLTLEAEETGYGEILKKVIKAAKKVQPDCRIKI